MRSLGKLAVVCLLGTATWAGDTDAKEPRNSGAAGSHVARSDKTTQMPARNAESWRMVCKNRVWWYWTPKNSWMVWNGTAWVHSPDGARYSADRRSSIRSFSYQSELLENDNAYPSQQQVNSANESGLGYEGLAILTKGSDLAPVQVFTSQRSGSTFTLPPELQVHSAGESGLGYEGLR